ncbi:proteoglycan 3 [Monodon monoceros]|uniref:Proteoglycan 3, pro eosinophil major basic protein 2 n=1 Tax=Monodon monoceros TaxID=40151 RepID=A0A8C6CDW3_MONMO|nr:proteoglycan 3 [Monodon monoceros]
MKCSLLLPLLLLGTVSALNLENDASHLGSRETQADLSQDLEGSGEQEGELALNYGALESEGEDAVASSYQDAFEDEGAVESDPAALDKDLQCPKEEDTVQLPGSPGCKTCRFLLVRTPREFWKAQSICRRCYRGNLVSIHNYSFNYRIQRGVSSINQGQVWIGGCVKGWFKWCQRFCWTDGSSWNFGYWALGQPGNGRGHCVALCTKGGRWRRARCRRRLPFVCAF